MNTGSLDRYALRVYAGACCGLAVVPTLLGAAWRETALSLAWFTGAFVLFVPAQIALLRRRGLLKSPHTSPGQSVAADTTTGRGKEHREHHHGEEEQE